MSEPKQPCRECAENERYGIFKPCEHGLSMPKVNKVHPPYEGGCPNCKTLEKRVKEARMIFIELREHDGPFCEDDNACSVCLQITAWLKETA